MQKPCHWEHPEKDTCLRHASWHPKSASLCPSSVRNDTSSNWGFQGSTFICEQLQRLWVHWCEADSYIWASGWFPEYGISQQGKSTLYDSPCWREHAGATKSPTESSEMGGTSPFPLFPESPSTPIYLFLYLSTYCSLCGMWILAPQPGIKPASFELEAQSLIHWTTREVPRYFLNETFLKIKVILT